MDITKNREKFEDKGGYKADFIIESGHVDFPARRQELAKQIADVFMSEARKEADAQQQPPVRPRRPLIRRNRSYR